MIALRVQREPSDNGATFGALYVNDCFVCWTLEDVIREPVTRPFSDLDPWVRSWKQKGATAIPAGRYSIAMEWSEKFQRNLPELKQVPAFTEVKIHPGNSPDDTEGCILVGLDRDHRMVLRSRDALFALMSRLHATPGEAIVIDIHNPPFRHYAGAEPKGLSA